MMLARKPHPDAAINQQRSKKIDNPVEAVDQADTGKNKEAPHQDRAENSPKQYGVLMLLGHGKITEDHKKEEEIVHTEREFEHIAGRELQGDLAALPKENQSGKSGGEGDPHGAPGKRLARTHNPAATVEENPEVEQRRPWRIKNCRLLIIDY